MSAPAFFLSSLRSFILRAASKERRTWTVSGLPCIWRGGGICVCYAHLHIMCIRDCGSITEVALLGFSFTWLGVGVVELMDSDVDRESCLPLSLLCPV